MSTGHLIKYALTLSPEAAVRGGWRYLKRILSGLSSTASQSGRSSFLSTEPDTLPHPLLSEPVNQGSAPDRSDGIIDHRFDVLGSGPVRIYHGLETNGVDGHRHPAHSIDTTPASLVKRLNPGNRERALSIRQLISPDYTPIDWHLDFKSGYRWSENTVSGSVPYGHEPGVDIKVPWELARLQHLPPLALTATPAGSDKSRQEFENQILDFVSANPPGWGVNWACTMDVAIRAANMVLAYDLFRARGISFTNSFKGAFIASIRCHGRHIREHLEWNEGQRGNHYLANIAGLTFVATFLASDRETDSWLSFALGELINEVEFQFQKDGSNFEASTSYHRLSAEMVAYSTAVFLGLSETRRDALMGMSSWNSDFGPFSSQYAAQLEKMAEFSKHITKPDGLVVQIGDNDSGRFFKFDLDGHSLDHRSTVAAFGGMFKGDEFAAFAGADFQAETAVVRSLSGGVEMATTSFAPSTFIDDTPNDTTATQLTQIDIILPDPTLTDNLMTFSYPEFGLFIWRSERLFLSVRCGPVGQNGRGGHAHNDQLAIELQIDGEDWIADPGSYTYTADPKLRDAYRSTFAHATPRFGATEPSSLGLGMFHLEDNAAARVLHFSSSRFHGVHSAYGSPVFRQIQIVKDRIMLLDGIGGEKPGSTKPEIKTAQSSQELRDIFGLTLPFSSGYGLRD
jgi:hypothetical protein